MENNNERGMWDGGIVCYTHKSFSKRDFIRLIESNFPDGEGCGSIVVVLTTESNQGISQTLTFGKVLDINKMYQ